MASSSSSYYQDDDVEIISDINVTPLVDVVLVLLVIFMVTAKLIVSRGISVETPKTVTGSQVASSLQLTINKAGKLFVNGKSYDDPALARAVVEEAYAADPEVKAIITADVAVPYGEVMAAIDLVKLAGVTRLALASSELKGAPE